MRRLRILTCCSLVVAAAIFFLQNKTPTTLPAGEGLVMKKEWLVNNKQPSTPKELVRPADQTFLTFPEWFLVFSPEEQAQYFKTHTATSFPFTAHIHQIWQSYHAINNHIRGNFPYNGGYHFMIWVIGSSATVEYALKYGYEKIIGRLTDTREVVTEEDRFNAKFTQDYVDFIKVSPWYAFNFKEKLKTLWTSTPLWGPHFIRKMERRYILTSELLVKYGYGKLIGIGTKTVYDEALPTTAVLVDSMMPTPSKLDIVKKYPDGSLLINLPRYDKFSPAITELSKNGFTVKEIAGNNSAILVSILLPAGDAFDEPGCQVIFTQPIASNSAVKRVVFATPVPALPPILRGLDKKKLVPEHVFDF